MSTLQTALDTVSLFKAEAATSPSTSPERRQLLDDVERKLTSLDSALRVKVAYRDRLLEVERTLLDMLNTPGQSMRRGFNPNGLRGKEPLKASLKVLREGWRSIPYMGAEIPEPLHSELSDLDWRDGSPDTLPETLAAIESIEREAHKLLKSLDDDDSDGLDPVRRAEWEAAPLSNGSRVAR